MKEQGREITHDDLVEALRDAHQEILDFQVKLAEYEWVESALRKRTRELNERVKELECLYSISNCLCRSNANLSKMLQDIVNIIPRGYQNPERTWAQLEVVGESFCSSQFQTTSDSHSADISINGRRAGALTVWVLAKPDSMDELLILPMERALLQTIALWIGKIMDIGTPNQEKPQPSRWARTKEAAAALIRQFRDR